MKYRKVTALINSQQLEAVEKVLIEIGVKGVSISQVSGYGEYHNFYHADMTCHHTRVEIFCMAEKAESIAQHIMQAAHIGQEGDGIVAVYPVETLYRIRTQEAYTE